MLYIEADEKDFVRAFEDAGRIKDFSHLALKYLFDYYRDLAEDLPGGIELDPIGICCEWGEFSISDLVDSFGYCVDREPDCTDEQFECAVIDYVYRIGTLLNVDHHFEESTYLFSEG